MPLLEIRTSRICKQLFHFCKSSKFSSTHQVFYGSLVESIKEAVAVKAFDIIPDLLLPLKKPQHNRNPFGFLSTFNNDKERQIIDEMLQSFISSRPRSSLAYSFLLLHTLDDHRARFPLALAVLQCMLRSGTRPTRQIRQRISDAWVTRSSPVSSILLQVQSVGYNIDCGVCNYLISSLCTVNQNLEAAKLLREMRNAGCPPDSNSYSILISKLCSCKRAKDALNLTKEMVSKAGLVPKQAGMVKVAKAILAEKDAHGAVELVDLLEKEVGHVDFETYELAVKACLECHEFFLSGKLIMGMTRRGFIPHMAVRQKSVEGLIGIGEWEMAHTLRRRLWDLGS